MFQLDRQITDMADAGYDRDYGEEVSTVRRPSSGARW